MPTLDPAVLDLLSSQAPEPSVGTVYPLDSSQVLLSLVRMVRRTAAPANPLDCDDLDGLIHPRNLRTLLLALSLRDPETLLHSRRVAMFATGLARYLGWENRVLKAIEVAALLHDFGKIGVPDSILYKPAPLNSDEHVLMTSHYQIGVDILEALRLDPLVLEILIDSHHRYNTAAPTARNLSDIHQGARILVLADAYESLRQEQVFRKAKSHDESLRILFEGAGRQFDGNVLSAMQRWATTFGVPDEMTAFETDLASRYLHAADDFERIEAMNMTHLFSYLHTLQSLYDGFSIVDTEQRMLVWSRGAARLLDRPSSGMTGGRWSPKLLAYADTHDRPFPPQSTPMELVLATGHAFAGPVRVTGAAGKPISIELQNWPLFSRDGNLEAVAEIYREENRRKASNQADVHELKLLASRDALTNVCNRGELEAQLSAFVKEARSQSNPEPLSVLFVDADHFKSVNDTYGHGVGDRVLVELARMLQYESYSGEIIGRYGGEEFVVICPSTRLDDAIRKAERFRIALQKLRFSEAPNLRISGSFGVSQYVPGDTMESLLERADQALYEAKQTGRNRTCHRIPERRANAVVAEAAIAAIPTTRDLWTVEERFRLQSLPELVIQKLGGYLDTANAVLLQVDAGYLKFRVGDGICLGLWGWHDDLRPVIVEVAVPLLQVGNRDSVSREPRTTAIITIRPHGLIRNSKAFRARAERLLHEFRMYLLPTDR